MFVTWLALGFAAALRRETVPVNMAMYGTTEYWEERYRAMG